MASGDRQLDAIYTGATTMQMAREHLHSGEQLLQLVDEQDVDGVVAFLRRSPGAVRYAGDGGRRSALHAAAAVGNARIAQLLIGAGADPAAPDGRRRTPLHCACAAAAAEARRSGAAGAQRYVGVVELLLQKAPGTARARDTEGWVPEEALDSCTDETLRWVFRRSGLCRGAEDAPDTPERPHHHAGGGSGGVDGGLYSAQAATDGASPGSVTSLHLPVSAPPRAGGWGDISPAPAPPVSPAPPLPRRQSPQVSPRRRRRASPRRAAAHARGWSPHTDSARPRAGVETTYDYLNRCVMPELQPALRRVAAERPHDPVAYLIRVLQQQHGDA